MLEYVYLLLADMSHYLHVLSTKSINLVVVLLTDMALNHLTVLRPLLLFRQVQPALTAASRPRAPLSHPPAATAAACTRLYATKKAKGQRGSAGGKTSCADYMLFISFSPLFLLLVSPQAKTKGQAAKVNLNSALVEDIISLDEVKADMAAVLSALKDDFTRSLSIRTSPGVLPLPPCGLGLCPSNPETNTHQ